MSRSFEFCGNDGNAPLQPLRLYAFIVAHTERPAGRKSLPGLDAPFAHLIGIEGNGGAEGRFKPFKRIGEPLHRDVIVIAEADADRQCRIGQTESNAALATIWSSRWLPRRQS